MVQPFLFWITFFCLVSHVKRGFSLDVGWLLGLSFCWVVMKCRNDIIFNSFYLLSFDALEVVRLLSWEWLLAFS